MTDVVKLAFVKMLMRFVSWSIYSPVVRPDCIGVMHTETFTAFVSSLRTEHRNSSVFWSRWLSLIQAAVIRSFCFPLY